MFNAFSFLFKMPAVCSLISPGFRSILFVDLGIFFTVEILQHSPLRRWPAAAQKPL